MKKLFDEPTRKILLRLLIIFISASFIFFFLEWRFLGNNIERVFEAIALYPLVFAYNILLLIFVELAISSLFKKPWTGPGITFIITIIVSYISVQKQNFRGQPLLPEDLMLADQTGTITKFINMGSLVRMLLACGIVLGLIFLLNKITKKIFEEKSDENKDGFWQKNLRIFRLTIFIVGIFGFLASSNFIIHHRESNEDIPFLDTHFVAWNQMLNYEKNGFIMGFLYNWTKFELKAPADYSEGKIAEIKSAYVSNEDEGKTSIKDADYNIIIVLNESFIDPKTISEYYHISGGVVTPNLHKMIKNTDAKNFATGKMYTIDYGGGTANVEFEVDTSMSTYLLNTTPFVDLFPRTNNIPSIYSYAKTGGYKTLAIHPFNAGMYKRNIALKKEGIDRFIGEDEMEFQEKDGNREYINDRSAYKETLKYLKEYDEKTIISLITMQNHAGYGQDNFDSYQFSVDGDFTEDEKSRLQVYLESLHTSDAYLAEFLNELENFDEKTVVLFYGDHFPGIVETIESSDDKSVSDLARVTPYFIWANFDLENKTSLPTTSPNCLVNTLLDSLNLEKPDYMNLVNDFCAETPIFARTYFASTEPEETKTYKDYELFTYDILGGKQYWYKK